MGKLNVGKAVKTGLAIYQAHQEDNRAVAAKEQNKIDNILKTAQVKISAKSAEAAQRNAGMNELRGGVELFNSFVAGKDDVTPAQVKSITEYFNKKKLFDITPFFTPNVNDKTGVVNSFTASNAASVQKSFDNDVAKMNAESDKIDAEANKIEAIVKKRKMDRGEIPNSLVEAMTSTVINSKEYKSADTDGKMELLSKGSHALATEATKTKQLTVGAQKEIESDMYAITKQLPDLDVVKENYKREFLTWPGKIKQAAVDFVLKSGEEYGEKLYKLSPEQRKSAKQFGLMNSALNRMLFKYVHDVSGAQFSIEELKRHKKSMMNPELNYEVFEGMYKTFVDSMKKGYRIKEMVLREGISPVNDTEEWKRRTGDLYNSLADPTLSKENFDTVGLKIAYEWLAKNPNKKMPEAKEYAAHKMIQMGYE